VSSLATEADGKVEGQEEEGGSRRGWRDERGAIRVVGEAHGTEGTIKVEDKRDHR